MINIFSYTFVAALAASAIWIVGLWCWLTIKAAGPLRTTSRQKPLDECRKQ